MEGPGEAEQEIPPRPPSRRCPPLHRQHRMEVEELQPPSSLPLHHTTNDHFPEDIRGYRHIPGPAPQLLPGFPAQLLPPSSPLPRQRSSATPVSSPGERLHHRLGAIGRVHSAPPEVDRRQLGEYPLSPPPSYEEVLKQPRGPPPSYEASELPSEPSRRGLCRGGHSLPGGRVLGRQPAQDIPDIYWEQAARELDFCTCRKCQVTNISQGTWGQ